MVKFSFIIPHKNLPTHLLRRCLDSIPHWKDEIQIIVVDDASDSSIVDFDHFPGVGEPCTEVYFTKEGKGPGFARNFGLNKATGEWILFADADDYYEAENLVQLLNMYPYIDGIESIGFKMKTIEIDGRIYYNHQIFPFQNKMNFGRDKSFFYVAKGPVQKLVRRDFIIKNNLKFDEFIGSEDIMFSLKLATALEKFALYDSVIYVYEKRENSLETSFERKLQCNKMNASITATKYLRSINKLEYRDAAPFYLWRLKHSQPVMFIWFLIKEVLVLGPKIAIADYKEVAKSDGVSANPFVFVWRKIRRK